MSLIKKELTNKEKFEKYHKENPHVFEMFKSFAFDAINSGVKALSAQLIIERMRWESMLKTTGERYKINNNYPPYYSRLFMEEFPEYENYFTTRQQVAA